MRRILVTAIGGDVGHSVLKCLKNETFVIGCDINQYPVGIDLVKKHYIVPLAKSPNYIESILNICDENQITHIIPVSEYEIEEISKCREKFLNRGIKLIINTESILDTCLDKYKTCEFLNNNNLCNIEFYDIDSFKENGKKYIIKLRKSCGSKMLRVFESREEIQDIVENYSKEEIIIQEYIDVQDSEYTVGIFRANENDTRVIIFKRQLQSGFTKLIELVHDDQIKKLAVEIAEKLNVVGSINIQLRKKDNQVYIFEINPRLSGTTNFRNQLGFTDVLWWLDYSDKKDISIYKDEYSKAIGIREMNEKIIVANMR